ncbi:MAG: type II toxin-antitoxin system prevent-host-death family antitoxin [Acidobacteria bacterium]|nr:type II toxin-antitoxin system prevent-host-death family antitoxin [Acidobacteriota bacterium]
MRRVGLFQAKQKLSELVERASEGERIGITRRGKLAAFIVPAGSEVSLKEVFANIDKIRKRIKRRPKTISLKSLIEEGRT